MISKTDKVTQYSVEQLIQMKEALECSDRKRLLGICPYSENLVKDWNLCPCMRHERLIDRLIEDGGAYLVVDQYGNEYWWSLKTVQGMGEGALEPPRDW